MVFAGEEFIMNIYDVDAESEKISQTALARLLQIKTVEALKQYREQRSRPVLIKNSIHAIGAAILYVTLLFGYFMVAKENQDMAADQDKIESRFPGE